MSTNLYDYILSGIGSSYCGEFKALEFISSRAEIPSVQENHCTFEKRRET